MRSLREIQNAIIFISRKGRKGRRTSNANYAIAEVVAGYARQRAQRQTVNEDDKTISQKDDKHIKCALGAHYLALSRSILQSTKFVQYLCNRNKALINKFNSISNFTTMGTFNNNSTWGKVLNIVITILTAIATTFGVQSCA